MRVVFRVNSRGPSSWTGFRTSISTGHDEHTSLKQWSAVKSLAVDTIASARPVLQSVRLPNGGGSRLLLVGGRPSIHLFLSADGEGEAWLPSVNVARVHK